MKFKLKRNHHIAAQFCKDFQQCVGMIHGSEYMLTRFQYTEHQLTLRFESRSAYMSFDGMSFQIYKIVDFKYALKRLRRMCL